eukprot:3841486-Ditylum_brightwellii.AAC.1
MAVDAIKSGLAKDNEDVELDHLMLEYDKMLSNIMSKCKKQCYKKYVHNINSSNNKKQQGNINGKTDYNGNNSQESNSCTTCTISTVDGESFVMGMTQSRKKLKKPPPTKSS